MNKTIEKNPKVFISYCQQNKEFSDAVLEFSNRLRREGIDAILDQYIQSPPEGWPRWMENSIDEADFVIMICTEEYYNRVMGKTKTGVGRGVKWEGNIIYQHLYNCDTLNNKFIPVVFCDDDIKNIPTPIKGATYYNIQDQERYDALYWRLRGINKKEKPVLGKLRPLPPKERKSLFVTSLIDIEAWNKAVWRGAAYLLSPENKYPPCFMLPFLNEEYAKKIFQDWIYLFGKKDKFEELRIAIIEGDIPGEEKGYSIHISSNLDRVIQRCDKEGINLDENFIMTISRIHRANPIDNFRMYNKFKHHYKTHRKYILMPCVLNEATQKIKPLFEYGIEKRELIIRHVSEIGEHDQDAIVVQKDKPWKEYKG